MIADDSVMIFHLCIFLVALFCGANPSIFTAQQFWSKDPNSTVGFLSFFDNFFGIFKKFDFYTLGIHGRKFSRFLWNSVFLSGTASRLFCHFCICIFWIFKKLNSWALMWTWLGWEGGSFELIVLKQKESSWEFFSMVVTWCPPGFQLIIVLKGFSIRIIEEIRH